MHHRPDPVPGVTVTYGLQFLQNMKYSGAPRLLAVLVFFAALPGVVRADPVADQAYQEAVSLYSAGNYSAALQKAESAAQADPKHWQAWQLAGNCRIALNDREGAIAEYGYSLAINPDNPQLKSYVDQLKGQASPAPAAAAGSSYESALAAYNSANYEKAVQDATAAVTANPSHWEAWQLLGSARYARGDKKGALEAYRKSLAVNPSNTQLKSFADSLEAELKPAGPAAAQPVIAEARPAREEGRKSGVFLGLEGGLAMADLAPMEKKFIEYVKGTPAAGWTPAITSRTPGTFKMIGLSGVGYRDWFGVSVAFNMALMEDMNIKGVTADAYGNSIVEEWKVQVGWLQGTIGAFGQLNLSDIAYVRGGPVVGIGMADVRIDRTIQMNILPFFKQTYRTSVGTDGFMVPVGIQCEGGIRLFSKVELFLKAGYEFRYAPALKSDAAYDKDGDGVIDPAEREVSVLVDIKDKPIPADLSGIYVLGGARIARW